MLEPYVSVSVMNLIRLKSRGSRKTSPNPKRKYVDLRY